MENLLYLIGILYKVGKIFATDITLATNKQSNPFFYLTIFTFFRILSKNGGFFRFRRVFSKKKPRKNPGEFFLFVFVSLGLLRRGSLLHKRHNRCIRRG